MSAPVCYLVRSDRGARLLGLRIVDRHDEATWQSPDDVGASAASDARAAAEWLADRLSRNGRAVSRLIIDTDGGVCSWVSATDTSPEVLRALIEHPFDEEDVRESSRFPELAGETALEPLRPAPASRKQDQAEAERVAVMAMPVVPARLFIDELDRLGVRVGSVEAMWNAAARAWDPAARSTLGGSHAERVIAETAPVTAIVLLDPAGRLVWSWSRGGELLTGGTQRIRTTQASESEPDRVERGRTRVPALTCDDVARLSAEWFSWSVQLGLVPARVVVVGRPVAGDDAIDAGTLGRTLTSSWPDAAVDIVSEEDPVGATLARLADLERVDEGGIGELRHRPGRSHRAMYRWSAVALLVAAAAIAAIAWRFLDVAGDERSQIASISQEYVTTATDAGLAVPTALLDLQSRIAELQQQSVDISALTEAPPLVLEEFEALSLVLSSNELTLRELSVSPLGIMVKVEVPDLKLYEALSQSIQSVAGPSIDWKPSVTQRNNAYEATFTGLLPEAGGEN